MRRIKPGLLDEVINEFLEYSIPRIFVEMEGVDPKYVKKQLVRKINNRNEKFVKVSLIGESVQLERSDRSSLVKEGSAFRIQNIPTIKR